MAKGYPPPGILFTVGVNGNRPHQAENETKKLVSSLTWKRK
jgi:hypothetical protein